MSKSHKDRIVQVSLTLPRAQIEALEKLACRIRDAGGKKLAINAILRSMIRLMVEVGVDPVGIKDEDELFDLLSRTMKTKRGGGR